MPKWTTPLRLAQMNIYRNNDIYEVIKRFVKISQKLDFVLEKRVVHILLLLQTTYFMITFKSFWSLNY